MTFNFYSIFHYNRTLEIIISHMIGMLNIEVVTMIMGLQKSTYNKKVD